MNTRVPAKSECMVRTRTNMAAPLPILAVRSSSGIQLNCCSSAQNVEFPAFTKDNSKTCRVTAFSRDGQFFAWCNGLMVTVVELPSCNEVLQLPKPKTACLLFSPLGSILATWEPYVANKENPNMSHNLHLWDTRSGKCVRSFTQKKQAGWAPQWTDDEKISARNVNNEVHFFENNNFDVIAKKIHIQKVLEFSLSRGPPPYHISCYVPGITGQPSFVRLYQYPKFDGISAAIASKSFFRADRVDMNWNNAGTGVLITTISDVDKTGASYYGEQKLHFLTSKGESSAVQLGKDGPIYSLEWNPNSTEFCVVYGFMPAKATIYNLKCEPSFDFGTGPRNIVSYNPFGNMLMLAGFGNLQGNVEVWDLKRRRLIVQTRAADSTSMAWTPDGEYFLTCTTSPRLRVGNGYKLWHYTGKMLLDHPWDKNEELYETTWQPHPPGTHSPRDPTYSPQHNAQQKAESTPQTYRPPAARGMPSTFKIHDENELPSNMKQQQDNALSKQALKNKKKRDAKKAKKDQPEQEKGSGPEEESPVSPIQVSPPATALETCTGDADKDKKIRNVRKKLEQIYSLKDQLKAGKKLELNQLEKLKREAQLVTELQALQIGDSA